MKIYWHSPRNAPPPAHAIFTRSPFLPSLPPERFERADRIDTLPSNWQPVSVKTKKFTPDREHWNRLVAKALACIEANQLEKVVLARRLVLECNEKPDPFSVAAALQTRAENATVFCFAEENRALVGASPEHLFKRNGSLVRSEAVAGTRRRGINCEEDQKAAEELQSCEKSLREFNSVPLFLKNSLSQLSIQPPEISPLYVKKTHNLQHLAKNVTAQMKDGVSDEMIRKSLHPTPALCGTPPREALDWISSTEPFDRGYYGGTVGWTTPEESESVVVIRSCFIQEQEQTVYLYAGTGIVKGSDASAEWDELNQKIALFQGIFL